MINQPVEAKLPPHNIDSEAAVLGACLVMPEVYREINTFLQPAHFYDRKHGAICAAIKNLYDRREAINQITVSHELDRMGNLEKTGGAAYLSHLIAMCPDPYSIKHCGGIVYRTAVARNLISYAHKVEELAYLDTPDINKSIGKAADLFNSFRKDNMRLDDNLTTPQSTANTILDMIGKGGAPCISFGYDNFDDKAVGLFPGEITIIGGRPSCGKTELALDICKNVTNQGKRVLFASVEMSDTAILMRELSKAVGVSVKELLKHGIPESVEELAVNFAAKVADSHRYILKEGASSDAVCQAAMKMNQTGGLDLVIVDYLQLLSDCWEKGHESRVATVGRASKKLKYLAKELNVPVILLSQLSRNVEYRADKLPTLADLRESGEIEQDADIVYLLHRDVDSPNYDKRKVLFVKMAKNRQLGAGDKWPMVWVEGKHSYQDGDMRLLEGSE